MPDSVRPRGGGWLVAVAAPAIALVLRLLLDPLLGDFIPYAPFFVAVIVAAWAGGLRAALLATAFGFLASWFFFVPPRNSFDWPSGPHLIGLAMYVVGGVTIAAIGHAMHTAQRRYEDLLNERRPVSLLTRAHVDQMVQKRGPSDALVLGFVVTAALIAIGGLLGHLNTGRLVEDRGLVLRTYEALREVEALLSTVRDAETAQRGYLLTSDPAYLQPWEGVGARVRQHFDRVTTALGDDAQRLQRIANLHRLVDAKLDELDRTIAAARAGDRDEAMRIVSSGSGKQSMDAVRGAVGEIRAAELAVLAKRKEAADASARTVVATNALSSSIGLGLVTLVFVVSLRSSQQRRRAALILAEQAERLRTTLGSIGDAVITTDVDARVTNMNPVAEQLTGWTSAEAAGQSLLEVFRIVNEDTRQPVENPAFRALRDGAIVGLANHTILLAKDGRETAIDDSAAPIRCVEGEIVGCVLVFRDVAERRRTERLAEESRAFAHNIVDTVRSPLLVLGHDLRVKFASRSFHQAFGTTSETIEGRPLAELGDGQWRLPDLDAPLATVIADGTPLDDHSFEMELPSRGRRSMLASARRLFREGNHTEWILLALDDVTERVTMEKRLREAAADLVANDRRKDEFLATLAHELRNPLAPLAHMIEVMKRAPGDVAVIASCQRTMERQLGQLVRLVDDLLDIGRITRDTLGLRTRRVDLASIVDHAVEAVRPLVDEAKHDLRVVLPEEPIELLADPARLAQALGNLLTNACKFSEPGGRVTVTAERGVDFVIVRVADDGIGIPSDKLDTIFGMFSQLDPSRERSRGGLGIGLALVRRLVEMHGGTVEARSEGVGKGSEFVVRLPILVGPPVAAPAPAAPPPSIQGLRVLVVDDNADAATSLAMLLRIMGNDAHVVHDGPEAVDLAGTLQPDVVLLDIGLPRMNGYDVCRRIRAANAAKRPTIIALTGWGQEADRRLSAEAGFDHHVVKPVDIDVLVKLLARP